MSVTLAQVSLNSTDALQKGVIDEFRKSSFLLDNIPFEPAVSPQGGGSTMTYSYLRVKTEAGAAFREFNKEYTAAEAVKEKISADLKIFGGSYEVDRVIADLGGAVNEGDPGNDYVAGLAFKNGQDCNSVFSVIFPDGAKLTFDCVINVTGLGGESTAVNELSWTVMSDGKPEYTEGSD